MEALAGAPATPRPRAGRLVRFLVLDTAAIAALIVAVSLAANRGTSWLPRFGLPETVELGLVIGVGVLVALPFGFGLVLAIRRLAIVLATIVVPSVAPGSVDQGRAPRRALVLALEVALAVATGLPLVAVSGPFLPPFGAPVLAIALALILLVAFWRTARDLDGHVRAGAELVVHVLARQGRTADAESFGVVRELLPGLGMVVPLRVQQGSQAAGRTLGELNLRGQTGATVVALSRGEDRRVFPEASERLATGDLIAVTGSQEAIDRVAVLMRATDTS
jgi:CPA2 family monovalent cation:H+ antiporter-2